MLGLLCILYFLNSQFSLTYHFLYFFLSSFPLNSPFLTSLVTRLFLFLPSLFSWSLCVLSIFMGTIPFIPNINLRWFSFFAFAFHQTFLSTIGTQHVLAVYRWVHSHYLLAVGSGFSPTTCLAANFFPFLGKSLSGHNTTISLFLLTKNPH